MTGARKLETHPGMLWFQDATVWVPSYAWHPVIHGTFIWFIRWRHPCAFSESGSNYNRQDTLLRPSGCMENSEPKSHGGPNSLAKWLYYYAFPPAIIKSSYCFTIWIITNCGKILKRREYQTTLPASWETCIQGKKQQLEPDMEQRTGSKLGKNTSRLYIATLII